MYIFEYYPLLTFYTISNASNMLFYPSTNCIKLNATFDLYTYNEHVYPRCFFAIAKNDRNFISRSRYLICLLRGFIYVYQCGKQGPYLHGGIKKTVSLTRVARCTRTYILILHTQRTSVVI